VVYLHTYAEQSAGLIHAYHLRSLRFVNDAFIKGKIIKVKSIKVIYQNKKIVADFY